MGMMLSRFSNFLEQVAYEHDKNCQFAFIGLETEAMRFPTYQNPDVDVYCETGDSGIEFVVKENANGEPLTIERMIQALNTGIEAFGDENMTWTFKDADNNVVFQTGSMADYEYSVTYEDGYKSCHSF